MMTILCLVGVVSAEYYAMPAQNVAVHGLSSQSSTNSYYGYARNANDGSLANNYLRSQCSYTKKDHEPYWMVDLRRPHKVMSVAVTNRVLDCCKERLFGADIRIGNDPSNGGKLNPRCGTISSIESGETLSFSCGKMRGQYVSISIPGREEHLILCEVQVFGVPVTSPDLEFQPEASKTPNGVPNVALKGISHQSSLINMYGESRNAIDGSLDSNFHYIQCTGTKQQKDPWWMVDLKEEHWVFTVAVTNRGDCCAEQINGAEVRVGNSAEDGGTKNPICGIISSMPNGKTIAMDCDQMNGRYVTVYIPGENRSLSICEVQVFGRPCKAPVPDVVPEDSYEKVDPRSLIDFFWNIFGDSEEFSLEDALEDHTDSPGKADAEVEGENLAFRGITSQSSTYDNLGVSENAIDGSTSTRYMSRHCSHTDLDFEPWWMVDLTKVYNISRVSVLNRGDCCKERIEGAEIRIGNSPERGGTQNPKCATITSMALGAEQDYACGLVGRYVTVTIPERSEYLTLCEVKVYGTEVHDHSVVLPPEHDSEAKDHTQTLPAQQYANAAPNVAPQGEATQSSTDGGNPGEAIDGSLSSCSRTEKEESPSWMLDLKSVHKVLSIAITNSNDSAPEDLDGTEISVSCPTAKGTESRICGTVASIGPGETFSFNCSGMEGQYVTVRNPGKGRVLSLCEVQVFGHPVHSRGEDWTGNPELQKQHHGVRNVAPQGVAHQSSHYHSRDDAKRAIDGSLDSNYMHQQCSHTRKELNPTWMVDLRYRYRIQTVAITNRGDCCRERINGAEIRIGDSRENLGVNNPRCATVLRMGYGETMSFSCYKMEGQYVSISLPNQKQYLSLCEVQVFGEPIAEERILDPHPTLEDLTTPDPTTTAAYFMTPDPTTTAAYFSEEEFQSQDLTGKSFLFPAASANSHVTLSPAVPFSFTAFTLCMKVSASFSEDRETILFSYHTFSGDELNIWQERGGKVGLYMKGEGLMFPKLDRSKEWSHLCLTWESKKGRCELWVNGKRSANKIYRQGHVVMPGGIAMLGQDQDSPGSDFDEEQSFVGKIKDLHMWDKVLSLKSIRSIFKGKKEQKGNVFDWSALRFAKMGSVGIV